MDGMLPEHGLAIAWRILNVRLALVINMLAGVPGLCDTNN